MRRSAWILVSIVAVLSMVATACTVPAPQVVEKVVTQQVEVEKVVTREVEKITEKEVQVVVTVTPATEAPVQEPPKEKQEGGILSVWLADTWPVKSWLNLDNWQAYFAIAPMAEPLFWLLPNGTLEGFLATGYDVSDDGLVYTVHLREGVTWHDGEPFTAEDVVYTMHMRYHPELKPRTVTRYEGSIAGLKAYQDGKADTIVGVKAIDAHTVEYTLESANVGFANLFLADWLPIVPKHVLEQLDQSQLLNNTTDYWITQPIGTGPYKFVKYATDQYIEYDRNDNYWAGKPGPDKLLMKIAKAEVAIVMLQKGELDFINQLPLTEVGRLRDDPTVNIVTAENRGAWWGMEFNPYTKNGLWQQPKAKQALLYAIDRQAYVDSILQGLGTVRDSFMDGTIYACPTMTRYTYDPEKAKALFDEVGLTESVRKETHISLMSWLGNKPRQEFLTIAQEYLRRLGFKVSVDIIDNSLITDYIQGAGPRGQDWDLFVLAYGPGGDPGTIIDYIYPGSTRNFAYFNWPSRPDADGKKHPEWLWEPEGLKDLLDQARIESDPQKRVELFQKIDCLFNSDIPSMQTAAASVIGATSKRLQGLEWSSFAGLGSAYRFYKPGALWLWDGK